MLEWIDANEWMVWTLAIVTVITFFGSVILTPAILIRLPEDYFSREKRPESTWSTTHPAMRLLIMFVRNVLACVFLVAGLAMLVLPGQGILTLIIAFVLLDFPGKYVVERWIVRRKSIFRSINWLRRRAGRNPLEISS